MPSDFRREGPQHKVTIAKPFAVGRFPVTRGEFAAFVKETGYTVPDEAYTYEGGMWKCARAAHFEIQASPRTIAILSCA